MSDAQRPTEGQPPTDDAAAESWRRRHPEARHPGDEGESTPPSLPEDEDVVPNRHSASAEAAQMRWRESHEQE